MDSYGDALFELDFEDTELARSTINDWVEDMTQKRITNLIKQGALDPATRMILTNTVYFLGKWKHPFDESKTRDDEFVAFNSKKVIVSMMHQENEFEYIEDNDVQVVHLPYSTSDQNLSMMIILPKDPEGFEMVQEMMTLERVENWSSNLIKRNVIVNIPRFEIEYFSNLKQYLQEMGISDAFSIERADFSKITTNSGFFLGEVIHRAFFDVNESGTEAAAATAVMILGEAFDSEIPRFNANHPFIFLIKDNLTDTILFLGRIMNPSI